MLTNSLGEEQWALLGHTAWLLGTSSVAFTLKICTGGCCSVAKLCLTLQPCGLQHARLPCPPLSPRVCSNSCPLSQWCYLPLLPPSPFCLQSFPVSGSFPMSWLFVSAGQTVVITASVSVLPMNIQGWFPLGLTGLISLLFKRLSRVFSRTTVRKHQFFSAQPSLWSSSHICVGGVSGQFPWVLSTPAPATL